MPDIKQHLPKEVSRTILDTHTVQKTYQAGYSTIIVKSTFDSKAVFSDLLYRILLQRNGYAS